MHKHIVVESLFFMADHRRRSCASPVLTAISLVNGKPWEPLIFDPRQNRHTLTDREKICHTWLGPRLLQNLVEIPPLNASGQIGEIWTIFCFFYLYPFLSNSPTGQMSCTDNQFCRRNGKLPSVVALSFRNGMGYCYFNKHINSNASIT